MCKSGKVSFIKKIIIHKVRLVSTTESVTQIIFLWMKKTKNDQYDRAQISNRH